MKWPERPTCHDGDGWAANFGQPFWREANRDGHNLPCWACGFETTGPYGESFRRCSHCGSMHPEDLVHGLTALGVHLGGTDWKYGWPHKFYIEEFPNLLAGKPTHASHWTVDFDEQPTLEQARAASWTSVPEQCEIRIAKSPHRLDKWIACFHVVSPGPSYCFPKFYSEHLQDDMDDEARELLLRAVSQSSGVEFTINETGKLHYRAPYHGYQKA